MKKDMDKIIFESRYEINEVHNALKTYEEEHKNSKTVKELINLLEGMYMNW